MNITTDFCITELVYIPNFILKWTKFVQKQYFQSKKENLNTTIEFRKFELPQVPDLALTNNFEFWDQIFPKRVFLVKNRKIKHHHLILHIQIRIDTKFQLQMGIFEIWTKLAHKEFFRTKRNKLQFCVCTWSLLTFLKLSACRPTDTAVF